MSDTITTMETHIQTITTNAGETVAVREESVGLITLGIQGVNGIGVPVGGATGQALVKTSGADFATGWGDVVATPAGSNTEIQYNNAGSFGASSAFRFDASTGELFIGDATSAFGKIKLYDNANDAYGAIELADYGYYFTNPGGNPADLFVGQTYFYDSTNAAYGRIDLSDGEYRLYDNSGTLTTLNTGQINATGIYTSAGSSISGGTLFISNAGAAQPALDIYATAGQSANIVNIRNSVGTIITQINSDGGLNVRPTSPNGGFLINELAASPSYKGMWLGAAVASPSASNYLFLGNNNGSSSAETLFNTPSYGVMQFRQNNSAFFGIHNSRVSFTANNTMNSGTGDSVARVSIMTDAAASKGLIVRGFTSQTANPLEIQDVAGGVLSSWSSVGKYAQGMSIGTSNMSIYGGTAGRSMVYDANANLVITAPEGTTGYVRVGAAYGRKGFYSDTQMLITSETGFSVFQSSGSAIISAATSTGAIFTNYATTAVPVISKGVASQTADLFQAQDSAGTVLAKVSAGGVITSSGSSATGQIVATTSSAAASVSIGSFLAPSGTQDTYITAGRSLAANQAGLLFHSSLGGIFHTGITIYGRPSTDFTVNQTGNVGVGIQSGAARFSVYGQTAATIVCITRGAASQTANLQQWQNSAGTVLASVDSAGAIFSASSITATGGFFSGGLRNTGGGNLSLSASTYSTANVNPTSTSPTITTSSGTAGAFAILPTYNQTGTAGGTDLFVNRTETALGSGSHNLMDLQVGGSSRHRVDNLGRLFVRQATTAGAPAYALGAMYFDTTLNKLRIGGASAWETVTSV